MTTTTIPTPFEAASKWQADALEAIQSYQAATVKTVEAWTAAYAKSSLVTPVVPELPAEIKAVFGDPAALVESSFQFASQVLDLNQKFAHELIAVQKAAVATPAPASPAPAPVVTPAAAPVVTPVTAPVSAAKGASSAADRKS